MSDRAYTNEWLMNKKKFSLLCGVYHLLQNLKWLWGLADESHFIEWFSFWPLPIFTRILAWGAGVLLKWVDDTRLPSQMSA